MWRIVDLITQIQDVVCTVAVILIWYPLMWLSSFVDWVRNIFKKD